LGVTPEFFFIGRRPVLTDRGSIRPTASARLARDRCRGTILLSSKWSNDIVHVDKSFVNCSSNWSMPGSPQKRPARRPITNAFVRPRGARRHQDRSADEPRCCSIARGHGTDAGRRFHPESAREQPQRREIVAVGPGRVDERKRVPSAAHLTPRADAREGAIPW
jgi:hypothetical protein